MVFWLIFTDYPVYKVQNILKNINFVFNATNSHLQHTFLILIHVVLFLLKQNILPADTSVENFPTVAKFEGSKSYVWNWWEFLLIVAILGLTYFEFLDRKK